MAVNLLPPALDQLFEIAGLKIGVTEAGVRKPGRKDLTVMLLEPGASVGGVFTTNRFSAAPVQLCRAHLTSAVETRAILINTG
ncbi:MAG: bifunctional ornithine acetyltransferase/N-acetylglutamate synthase, partial [Burkholderiales bacterium PBB4]